MTGSYWAPIVIPIVTTLALFTWLGGVYFASAHPGWRGQPSSPLQEYVSMRAPLDATESGAPTVTSGAGAPDAKAPRPRAPSESEQLADRTGQRRLGGDERAG